MDIMSAKVDFGFPEDELDDGVVGFIMADGDTVYLPFIEVLDSGKGKCQAYLEKLEREYGVIKIPCVVSRILLHILQKRGYKLTYEYSKQFEEAVDVWVKEKQDGTTKKEVTK